MGPSESHKCSMEVHDKLQALEIKIEVLCERVESAGTDLKKIVEKHDHFIHGNGKLGAETRLHHLEKSEERRSVAIKALLVAVFGLIMNVIRDIIR